MDVPICKCCKEKGTTAEKNSRFKVLIDGDYYCTNPKCALNVLGSLFVEMMVEDGLQYPYIICTAKHLDSESQQ